MALTTCPDCSTQVSSEAAACPKCGRPTEIVRKDAKLEAIGALIAALAVVAYLAWKYFG